MPSLQKETVETIVTKVPISILSIALIILILISVVYGIEQYRQWKVVHDFFSQFNSMEEYKEWLLSYSNYLSACKEIVSGLKNTAEGLISVTHELSKVAESIN